MEGSIKMISRIKIILEPYPKLFKLAKSVLELKYFLYNYIFLMKIIFPLRKALRFNGYSKRYNSLKRFKNKHLNERCFIIATGPSLRIEDLEKLKDEVTFSMNSIVLSYEKTEWRPTYYTLFDSEVYKKFANLISNSKMNELFFGDNIYKYTRHMDAGRVHYFPLYMFNHENSLSEEEYYTEFSNDIFDVVYDSGTIMYCTLQIAVYMGFKEIYLLGADSNYYGNAKHFIDYSLTDYEVNEKDVLNKANKKKDEADNRYYRIMTGYQKVKEYADNNGIKIYNATRGGMLELFERVDFDKIEGM